MAFRQVLRNATRPAMRQVRNFGGHSKEEALKSMNSMITNTKIGVAICGAMTVISSSESAVGSGYLQYWRAIVFSARCVCSV